MNWFRRKRIQHPVAKGLYVAIPARPFLPGASALALGYERSDPIQFFNGSGRNNVPTRSWRTSQGIPAFAGPTVIETSLGGTVVGQFLTQPLSNPDGTITN